MDEETKPTLPLPQIQGKKPLDSSTKKAILTASLLGGTLVGLLTTCLIIGNLPVATVNYGPDWSTTKSGFYGKDGNLILDAEGSATSFFTIGKVDETKVNGIVAINVPTGAANLVIPSSYLDANGDSSSLSAIGSAQAGSNVFGATATSNDILGIYAPAFLSSLGENAFANLNGLTSVSLASASSGSFSVGNAAFAADASLQKITLPRNLTSLGDEAFSGDAYLENALLGDTTLKTIGQKTFQGCVRLEEVALPSTLNSLGTEAFFGTSALTSLTYNGTEKSWKAITFASDWALGSSIQEIVCSDGTITL